jgi:8-oxo-dGTP pyrophosphatase MutT (NUDIX family)
VSYQPRDNEAYRFPVSVKGVIIRRGRVVVLKNEREEWELPGGKLEPDETPEVCVRREICEELQLDVQPRRLLDTWVYHITPAVRVLIVTYGCTESTACEVVLSHEHKDVQWVPLDDVRQLPMPQGYKASIAAWAQLRAEE